jgi:hypothetical protein
MDIPSPPMTLPKPYQLLWDIWHPKLLDWRHVSTIIIDTIYNILSLDFYIIYGEI